MNFMKGAGITQGSVHTSLCLDIQRPQSCPQYLPQRGEGRTPEESEDHLDVEVKWLNERKGRTGRIQSTIGDC